MAAERMKQLLRRFQYPLLILLVGIGLMLLPEGKVETSAPEPTEAEDTTMEAHLQSVLSQISGAGEVAVLLSEDMGSETLYQTDTREGSADTVIVTDAERNETGLVRRTDPPRYLGAVVVCQGADDPQVRLAVVEAVKCATGLGADRISVIKMK